MTNKDAIKIIKQLKAKIKRARVKFGFRDGMYLVFTREEVMAIEKVKKN